MHLNWIEEAFIKSRFCIGKKIKVMIACQFDLTKELFRSIWNHCVDQDMEECLAAIHRNAVYAPETTIIDFGPVF